MNKNDTNNKATRSKIIAQFLNFGGAGCLDDNPLNPNGKKHYCILRSFREKNIDIRLYLSNAGKSVEVDSEKVATMFEATSDLGDWSGAALVPHVQSLGKSGNAMRFTVKPGDGSSPRAFLRIRK
jgi:hypothetical protein